MFSGKGSIFPPQKLPMSKKDEPWQRRSVDSLIARHKRGDERHQRMKTSYDIINSIFDLQDLKYVIDPFNVKEGFPARIQNINIIRPKIEVLKGEFLARPRNYHVFQTDERAVQSVIDKEKELLSRAFEASIMMTDNQEMNKYLQERLQEIKAYIKSTYYSASEQTASATVKYLREKLDLDLTFLKSWEDGLVAGESIHYVGILNGDPILERVNPLTFSYDRDPELRFIEDGEWAVREMLMTTSDVYDRFGDIIDEKDFDTLLDRVTQGGIPYTNSGNNTGANINTNYIDYYNKNNINTRDWVEDNRKGSFVSVYHCVWKSFKKIGYLTFMDESGESITEIVDETYKTTEGETIEWDWISELWEGYRFWNDLYSKIRPVEYQYTSLDDPSARKLPFVGAAYNTNNTEGKSLVEIMKPLQYFYLVLFYRLELAIARDAGKPIIMDITQIPKSMGIEPDKWMHYLKSLGVVWINPYECFAPGTKVMMADFSLKNIEDIQVGEYVIGPDGKAKQVLHTHSGLDNMYRIKSRSGSKDQIVNSAHKNYYFEKDHYNGNLNPKLKTALELIEENKEKPYKAKLRYLKKANNLDLNWDSEVNIDPYLLGLWLGDGSTGKVDISNIDVEIVSYLEGYAKEHNLLLSINHENQNSDVMTLRLHLGAGIKNPIKESLKSYGILNSKDIPEDFIYTTRENRLKLLAGLIDTDGYYSERDKLYIFSQSEDRKHIVEKAAFIARSLGFKCTVNKYRTSHEKYILDSDNISICQPTWVLSILNWDINIPTKIERKQAPVSNKRGDKDYNSFDIAYEGIGEYYGIHIDSEDHLFVLEDFTIVHNTGWDIPGREGGKPSAHNQITSVDMSMSNVISEYIALLDKVEQMMVDVSGISDQRVGQGNASDLVRNVQSSITHSSNVTEPLFYMHDKVIKNSITMLLNVAKYAWRNSNKQYINYVLSGPERMFIEITDDFVYSDHDVFVSNSNREIQNIESLRTLFQPAMQNGASLLDIASIMTAENLNEIKMKLQDIEDKRMKLQQQMSEAEQQTAQQEFGLKQDELRIKEEDSIRKAETALQIAMMGQNTEMPEEDNSSMEIEKLNLQKEKQTTDFELRNKDLQEKIRSNKAKEQISRSKPKTTSK
jgi:hypothetical protein